MLMQRFRVSILLIAMLASACSSNDPLKRIEKYERYSDPLEAVMDIRKEMSHEPGNIHLRALIHQYEIKASEYYYHKGMERYYAGNYDEAVEYFKRGLTAYPNHEKLQQAIVYATDQQEADKTYLEAVKNYQVGKLKESEALLAAVIEKVPMHENAQAMLKKVRSEIKEQGDGLDVLDGKQKISLNFRNTNIKTAFAFLARSFNINIIFDESVKEQSITLYAREVSFRQALSLMLSTSKMFYQRISKNTILIASDTKSKRDQYEEFIIKTFQLRTVEAKQMSEIIKGVLKVDKLVINESMNTIMVRDSSTVLDLVSKIIEINDRRPAELLLDVEILEVNRNKAEQLGVDYGSVITTEFPNVDPATISLGTALNSGTITLPNVAFRYFKQDVDGETLANPKIRVINQKPAKIHIGDRVPLRSSTIQNAAGQTQTSYEYSEIGIRLDVNPTIHYDNTVTVQLSLEVSSLGQNLGTPEEPTYSIGTRNTQTQMLLKDGETAVIGGLIRDEERSNMVELPGLGDIPLIGMLFRSKDDSLGRTDVLLTITPRIIRGWDIPRKSLQSIHSGTADRLSTEPLFPEMASNSTITKMKASKPQSANNKQANNNSTPNLASSSAVLSFDKSLYTSKSGDEFLVNMKADNLSGMAEMTVPILFNKDIVELKNVTTVSSDISDIQKRYTNEGVELIVHFKENAENQNQKGLFNLVMSGNKNGISYLTTKQASVTKKIGGNIEIDSRASRIVIK